MENAMKTAIYLAAFVKDCQGLKEAWDAVPGTPALFPHNPPETVQYAHHSTSIFGPESEDVYGFPIGEDVVLEVSGWVADDKAHQVWKWWQSLKASTPWDCAVVELSERL